MRNVLVRDRGWVQRFQRSLERPGQFTSMMSDDGWKDENELVVGYEYGDGYGYDDEGD